MTPQRLFIDIAAISLDTRNLRHRPVNSQQEALATLLANEKTHKVCELAEDIVAQKSLDPSSPLIVTEEPEGTGLYVALEGNRRIAALKTLMTPSNADGYSSQAKFKELHKAFTKLKITKVECVIMTRKTAKIWIERRHSIQMSGKGLLKWGAEGTALSRLESTGRNSKWLIALNLIEKYKLLKPEALICIDKRPTTVERVLTSKKMRETLGLRFNKDGTVTPDNNDEKSAAKLLQSMFIEMSKPDFSETAVTNKDLQSNFIQKFEPLSVKKQTDQQEIGERNSSEKPGTSSALSKNATQESAIKSDNNNEREKTIKDRKELAKKGLYITNENLNKFYKELKNLNVDQNPFISCAVIRIFLEKSCNVYLEYHKIPTLNATQNASWIDYNVKLKDKVLAVLNHLDPEKKNRSYKDTRDVTNGQAGKLHSIEELNEAIHNHKKIPATKEIIIIWDRYHPFLNDLFASIKEDKSK